MLLLTSISDKIRLTTAESCDIEVHASYVDLSGTTVTPGRLNTAISTATTTDVVASPGSGTQRNVKLLTVRNAHATASVTVTILHTDGTTQVEIIKRVLIAGESLIYTDSTGFTVTGGGFFPSDGSVLDLDLNDAPGTPGADTVRVFGRKVAGRMLPAFVGPNGLDSSIQPFFARNKVVLL